MYICPCARTCSCAPGPAPGGTGTAKGIITVFVAGVGAGALCASVRFGRLKELGCIGITNSREDLQADPDTRRGVSLCLYSTGRAHLIDGGVVEALPSLRGFCEGAELRLRVEWSWRRRRKIHRPQWAERWRLPRGLAGGLVEVVVSAIVRDRY